MTSEKTIDKNVTPLWGFILRNKTYPQMYFGFIYASTREEAEEIIENKLVNSEFKDILVINDIKAFDLDTEASIIGGVTIGELHMSTSKIEKAIEGSIKDDV